jgi:methanethiol S-methyltransferase
MVKRAAFFLYGVACYGVFFATFLYAVGFVGNLGVPHALDGVPQRPWPVALAIDVVLLGVFAVQHSVMARPWFKERWTRLVSPVLERSTYVLFSSLALILLFAAWQPVGGVVWSAVSPAARATLWVTFAFGWGLVLVCTFLIDHFDLFGLRQVWLFLRGRSYAPLPFVTPGPYRVVRHPLYAGWLFAFWGTPHMTASHLVFAIATTAYILVAIRLEEADLVQFHGTAYEGYRRQVPMLLPRLRPGTASATALTVKA